MPPLARIPSQRRDRLLWSMLGGLLVLVAALPSAQSASSDFDRGVVALHNFDYEEANAAFIRAQRANPGMAMAYWGEAMTYHQSLWRNEDLAAGRRALMRMASTPSARSSAVATAKGRGLIDAVAVLFSDGDSATRRIRYADAMAQVYAGHPEDPDVGAFYALALLGTMSRSLIGYVDAHEGHSASLAGSETQAQVADILDRVLSAHPTHPGALHYSLHNYDDPAHARLALDKARAYAAVAARSSHALHMPAHIFVQLGMWTDAVESDRAAFAASEEWVQANGHPPAMKSYHALSWLQYELLQLGQYREVWESIEALVPVVQASGDTVLLNDLSSMRARFVVETRRWDVLANERNFGNVNELYAIGASAARTGNLDLARRAHSQLGARAVSEEEGDLRPAIAVMERQVAALIELAEGRVTEAVETMVSAARLELDLPAPLGLPVPVKPAPELLGELLLTAGRPAEAVAAFQQALGRNANRTQSVLGLARALAADGRPGEAREHYRTVLATYSGADSGLDFEREARAALAEKTPLARGLAVWLIGVLAVLAAAGIWVRRRRV